MNNSRQHAHLLNDGQSQIIKILQEFEMGCDEAIIRREGKRLILEPVKKKGLLSASEKLNPLDGDFPNAAITRLPLGDIRL